MDERRHGDDVAEANAPHNARKIWISKLLENFVVPVDIGEGNIVQRRKVIDESTMSRIAAGELKCGDKNKGLLNKVQVEPIKREMIIIYIVYTMPYNQGNEV